MPQPPNPKENPAPPQAHLKARVMSFHCVLKDKLGHVLSSSFNSEVLLDSSSPAPDSGLLPDLVRELQGLKKGESKQVCLPAERAFGFYDDELLVQVPVRRLSAQVAPIPGMQYLAETATGKSCVFRVIEVGDKFAVLDGNHPLAGQDLVFEVEATEVRDATRSDFDQNQRKDPAPTDTVILGPINSLLH